MRIWLDDERDPTDPTIQQEYGAVGDELWVKSPEEAVTLLQRGGVTSISLDNDLGDYPFERVLDYPNGITLQNHPGAGMREGYQLADWIEEQAYFGRLPRLEVKAHSANPVAAARMRVAIANAERYWDRE